MTGRFADLAGEIGQTRAPAETRIVGIDGCGGSGKSTFADQLSKHLDDAPIIHTDDFASWDTPVDWWPRMKEQVIDPLAQGDEARWQRYDWEKRELAEWHTLEPGGTVIIEGVTAIRNEWRDQLAYSIWVGCPREIRLERGLERDGQEALPQWESWMAAEDAYIADQAPREHADLVVSGAPDQALDPDEFTRLSPSS
jgi:uridine kinase